MSRWLACPGESAPLKTRDKRGSCHLGQIGLSCGQESYTLYRVSRRKRLTVLVNDLGEIEVRVPTKTTLVQAEVFLQQHGQWLSRRLQAVRQKLAERPLLRQGLLVPFLDEQLTLRLSPGSGGGVIRIDNDLWMAGQALSSEGVQLSLERWFRLQARFYLSSRLHDWSRMMGVEFGRFTVRGQRTRWGSCSAGGDINLNWRLLCLPSRVVDYVVVHELSHRRHMNHSPAFWALLGRFIPDYAVLRASLKNFEHPW